MTVKIRRNGPVPGADQWVDAELREGLSLDDVCDAEDQWSPERSRITRALLKGRVPNRSWPESLHWRWSAKAARVDPDEAWFAGVVAEHRWQGLIQLDPAPPVTELVRASGPICPYVDFLEAAPWNWPASPPVLGRRPEFSYVGFRLLQAAVRQSVARGFTGGWLSLHALPGAESFYSRLGLKPMGKDPEYGGLAYFVLGQAAARDILAERDVPGA